MDKVLIELEADKHMEFIHPALPYKIIQRQP
jgi:hypothetical protein